MTSLCVMPYRVCAVTSLEFGIRVCVFHHLLPVFLGAHERDFQLMHPIHYLVPFPSTSIKPIFVPTMQLAAHARSSAFCIRSHSPTPIIFFRLDLLLSFFTSLRFYFAASSPLIKIIGLNGV